MLRVDIVDIYTFGSMSTIRCDRKNMTLKVTLKITFVVNFFNGPPPIQTRRMRLRLPRQNIS